MALRKKKANGIDSPSTNTDSASPNIDPLFTELSEIFAEYPEGAELAYWHLTETNGLNVDITNNDGSSIWRVRRDRVDRCISGVSDRVQLKCLENSKSTEP